MLDDGNESLHEKKSNALKSPNKLELEAKTGEKRGLEEVSDMIASMNSTSTRTDTSNE